ncbi:hypothetical protein FACS1894211_10190 [Clostridia bacterium]|nr:hypothetical protein FACS1894211_10190 [Clostridia bacterium]
MKDCDQVKLAVDKEAYAKKGVYKGMVGFIMDPRCINGERLVSFSGEFRQTPDGVWYTTDIECEIKEEDLEIVTEA